MTCEFGQSFPPSLFPLSSFFSFFISHSLVVSPSEYRLKACKMFAILKLPLRLAKFESGVLVVQLVNGSDGGSRPSGLQDKIVDHLKKSGGIGWRATTATKVSMELNIALFVAQAELAEAEKNQLVVRDVHYDGTQWYLAHPFFNKCSPDST
jgi:hypothetical protein